jgi:hypothetical protein
MASVNRHTPGCCCGPAGIATPCCGNAIAEALTMTDISSLGTFAVPLNYTASVTITSNEKPPLTFSNAWVGYQSYTVSGPNLTTCSGGVTVTSCWLFVLTCELVSGSNSFRLRIFEPWESNVCGGLNSGVYAHGCTPAFTEIPTANHFVVIATPGSRVCSPLNLPYTWNQSQRSGTPNISHSSTVTL